MITPLDRIAKQSGKVGGQQGDYLLVSQFGIRLLHADVARLLCLGNPLVEIGVGKKVHLLSVKLVIIVFPDGIAAVPCLVRQSFQIVGGEETDFVVPGIEQFLLLVRIGFRIGQRLEILGIVGGVVAFDLQGIGVLRLRADGIRPYSGDIGVLRDRTVCLRANRVRPYIEYSGGFVVGEGVPSPPVVGANCVRPLLPLLSNS